MLNETFSVIFKHRATFYIAAQNRKTTGWQASKKQKNFSNAITL